MKTKNFLNLKSWLLMMLMLIGAGGNLLADEVFYTLDGTVTGGGSGYAIPSIFDINNRPWSIEGNTTENPWRIGGKSITKTDREVYSTAAMEPAITKVELTVGNASDITVNSLKLIVASDESFETSLDEVSKPFAASSTITFTPTSGTEWAKGAYYKFVFNVTVTGSKNKYVEFISAKFFKDEDAPITYTVTFDPGEGTFVSSADFPSASNTKEAGSYTLPSASRDGYTFNGWVIGDNTPIKGSYQVSRSVDFVADYTKEGFKELSFNLSSNPGDWPTANSTTLTNYTYSLNSVYYTFALQNVKCNNGYLMLTKIAILGLPAIEGYKLTKVVAKNTNGCSSSTYVGISSRADQETYISGGEAINWKSTGSIYTYDLTSTDVNTMYFLYVTNSNAQITNLTLTYEAAKEKEDAGLEYSDDAVSAVRGQSFTSPALTNSNNLTVVYSSSNEAVATVDSETGSVTLLKAGETTITATFDGDSNYKPGSASYTLTVTVPSHTATFFVNGQQTGEGLSVAEDAAITFPEVDQEILDKKFVGWTTTPIIGSTDEKPATLVTSAIMEKADVIFYAVYANVTPGSATTVTDVLNRATTGVPDQTEEDNKTYTSWNNKEGNSGAVYAGQSAGDKNSIQLRSNNSNSGIISTTSGGKLKKVVVVWNEGTTSGRTLNVYGSNSEYSAATDLYNNSKQGTMLGSIVKGTSTELIINGDYQYVGLRSASGAMYLSEISITWEGGTPATYSGYCTTIKPAIEVAAPIVFHDSGTYREPLKVTIVGQGIIKYTLNGGAEQTYSAPFTISETTKVTAWAEQDGIKSAEVSKTFKIVTKPAGPTVGDGYYNIKTNDGKYVNVAGRKTVTLVSDNKGKAGTVIRVKANDKGQVEVLRSQGVDLPRYAERAMSYVPELVKEVVNKLAANVDDPIIGEQGADLILAKFNKEFDYHLYLEEANGGYRIYGRTPSMKPVVDFYAENKDLVDSRLPKVEDFVKEVLQKIVDKMERGQSVVDMFKIKTVWKNMGGTLTDPDVDQAKFFEEVLSSEENTWQFAYQTGMLYWEKVKGYLKENAGDLGDYGKYLEKIPNVQPNFMYYIVPSASGVDIISQGNVAIENDEASAIWTLTPCDKFVAKMDVVSEKNIYTTTANETKFYTEYYTTLYTDFAYTLPEGVKAYKINGINTKYNTVLKEALKSTTIPAQTPVLLFAQDDEIELTLDTNDGSALSDNTLYGNDWLINKYPLNTPQLETIFALLTKLSSSLGEKYEHLKRLNAGTVNNKYFFNLAVPTKEGDFKEDFNNGKIKVLSNGENGIGFYSNYDKNLVGNEAFMFSEGYNPIMLSLIGDVNRDGDISIADVTALVNIILGKAKYPDDLDKYDFDAANVNRDTQISIADVTKLVNIILGKK